MTISTKSTSISYYNMWTSPAPWIDLKTTLDSISKPPHPEYIEFTRRLSPLKQQNLEQRLQSVSQQSIDQLLKAITLYDWYDDPLFTQPGWTDTVMEALRRGLIDRYAASTLLLFWQRRNEEGKNLQIIPLFDQKGNSSPVAHGLILQSLTFAYDNPLRSSSRYLNLKQVDQFFGEMKKASHLQKYFFLSYERLMPYSGMTVQYQIADCTPLQYFARPASNDFGRMTPSPQMMVEFLTILCGKEHVVYPNLILGSSEWSDFLDITKHDVQLPSPDEPIPEIVHNARVIKDDFTKHDLGYHLFIKSGIPKRIREIYAQTSLLIKKLEEACSNPQLSSNLKSWRERMLDMDLSVFRQDRRQKILQKNQLQPTDLSPLFWAGFVAQLSQIKITHNVDIDEATLKTIIMQMPLDPILGKKPQYTSLIEDTSRFFVIANLWEERIKSPKTGQSARIEFSY